MNAGKVVVLTSGALLLAALVFLRPLRLVENIFYDLNFAVNTKTPLDSVIIVGIDPASISEAGAWPWPRSTLSQCIEAINAGAPAALAVDILFPPRPDNPAGNDSLSTALCNVKKLVLPFRAGVVLTSDNTAVIPASLYPQRFLMVSHQDRIGDLSFFNANRIDASDAVFSACAGRSGFINVTTSRTSQKLRRLVQVIKAGEDYFPSFSLSAAAAFMDCRPEEFILDGSGQIVVKGRQVPISKSGTTLLHYRGRPGSIPTVSAVDVLRKRVDKSLFANKLVFLGVTDAATGVDFFTTPVGSQFPGVEVWAGAALDIIQNSWIREDEVALNAANAFFAFLLFPGLLVIVPPRKRALIVTGTAALVLFSIGVGFFLFHSSLYFWNPAYHVMAGFFTIAILAGQKNIFILADTAPLDLSTPPDAESDHDVLPPPQENDFLHTLPQVDSAQWVAQQADLCGGRVVRIIGSGGMADVYLVWNPRLEVYRAVKVLKPDQASLFKSRFETEIRILSKMLHPHIVRFYGVGEWRGLPYIEMEYVPGTSLDDVYTKCAVLTPSETMAIGMVICRALQYAHTQATTLYGKTYKGIIHRDLKPANIMLSKSGRVKLTDFGIARPEEVGLHTMDLGKVVGTLPYLAPEQLDGSDMTSAVDLYALGATLYEFVSGERAFPQTEINALVAAKASGRVKALPGHVPQDLVRIIAKAMALQPGERYASAQAMERDLEKALRPLLPPGKPAFGIFTNLVKRFST
jgi:CHASE2 domain-containing sensor protein/tRNA A-37 threonylcarbamoyl transferase component Bud32